MRDQLPLVVTSRSVPALDQEPRLLMAGDASPLFSVVTVSLNAAASIAEALDSALAQEFDDFEIVVVDGGSTDSTLDIVREREASAAGRLRWISEPDKGLYDAMNKGLGLARGRYIEYLGADDLLVPGALQAVARVVAEQGGETGPDIVCGAVRVAGPHGDWDEPAAPLVRRGMPQRAPVRHQSTFVRAEKLRAVAGFDTRYRIAADYDAYLKLHEAGASERLIAETLSEFRLGGVSSTNAVATAREYRDIRIAHGANPLVEGVVMWKSALGVRLHAAMMRVRAAG